MLGEAGSGALKQQTWPCQAGQDEDDNRHFRKVFGSQSAAVRLAETLLPALPGGAEGFSVPNP